MSEQRSQQESSGARVEREAERKYEMPPGAAPLDVSAVAGLRPGTPVTERLVAEYFDTPELAILGNRCILRRRTGGGDDGWHMKTPGDGVVRVELHAPLGAARRVPPELRAELAEVIGERPVLPIVSIETERTTTPMLDPDGATLALVCDDRVHARVLRRDVDRDLTWRELEIELAGGAPLETFDAFDAAIAASGLEPSRHLSKLAHVLEGVEPAIEPTARDEAGEAVLAAMATHVGRLQALEASVRVDAPDAVHQARVATRRLRSLLKVFKRLFEREESRALCDELRWAAAELGAPRDAEVLRELIDDELVELAALELTEHATSAVEDARQFAAARLGARHEAAFADLREALDSSRWDDLHAALTEFLLDPPLRGVADRRARVLLRKLAGRAAETVAARVALAEGAATSRGEDMQAWHEVRKSAKAARYAYETLAELEGGHAKRERKAWKAVAQPLGEVQDAVMLEHEFAALARDAAGDHAAAAAVFEAAILRIRNRMRARLDEARVRLDELA